MLASTFDSLKLNPFSYVLLRIKQFIFGHKLEIIQNFKNSHKLKKRVFNELTIYKMFFEIEKFKVILLDSIQREAFKYIKLDFKSIFEQNNEILFDFEKTSRFLSKSERDIDQKLAFLLKESRR